MAANGNGERWSAWSTFLVSVAGSLALVAMMFGSVLSDVAWNKAEHEHRRQAFESIPVVNTEIRAINEQLAAERATQARRYDEFTKHNDAQIANVVKQLDEFKQETRSDTERILNGIDRLEGVIMRQR